jgi:two-component system response regulator AtoC
MSAEKPSGEDLTLKVLFAGSDQIHNECASLLRGVPGVDPSYVRNRRSLLAALEDSPPDLLVLGDRHPSYPLATFIHLVRRLNASIPILVLSSSSRVDDAVNAFHLGASDFLTWPAGQNVLIERIRSHLGQPVRISCASFPIVPAVEGRGLPAQPAGIPEDMLFSANPQMQVLRQMVEKVKDTDLPILITGESGTGKEIIARFLWQRSSRRNHPFLKVNCAAIPTELLESELFGFEKGAFTGAYRNKPGKFVAANGGTLLLDEISELPYPLQSKLLHVLQDGNFSALGAVGEISVDVRVIAATNRMLEEAVRLGTFRGDLFFRLNVLHIHVPPLRERPEDIMPLAEHFLNLFAEQYGKPLLDLGSHTRSMMHSYPWPGNVRELENLMRRSTVLGNERFVMKGLEGFPTALAPLPAPSIAEEDVPVASTPPSLKEIARQAARSAERRLIARVLEDTRWNRKKAARILEISYKTLLTKIKETGLDDV